MEVNEVIFGERVGNLRLGTHINKVVEYFKENYSRENIEIAFPNINSCNCEEIVIKIPEFGIRLRFQPLSQCLYIIEIFNVQKKLFSIHGTVFGNGGIVPTFKSLQRALGPAFPGKFISSNGEYLIQFDGIGLVFTIPLQYESLYANSNNLPIDLPDGNSSMLSKIFIYHTNMDIFAIDTYPDDLNTTLNIHIAGDKRVSMQFDQRTTITPTSTLHIGSCPQDVVSLLGSPNLASHFPVAADLCQRFEYWDLGLEFFFSPRYHLLYRVVVHCNLPQHQDFSRYNRCGFVITAADAISSSAEGKRDEDMRRDESRTAESLNSIGLDTRWPHAQALLQQWCMGMSGASDWSSSSNKTPAIKSVPNGCPFQSTRLYGFPQVIRPL